MTPLLWLLFIGLPLFVVFIIVENIVAKRKKLQIYTLSDSVTNFSCGLLERIFDLFFSVIVLFGFNYIHENIAPFKIELSVFSWIIGLLATDFIAYWFHRLSHEINFLWAAHIVHHQSEELNLTTVFRVSFLAVVFRAFFFVWLAFAGFDVFTIVTTIVFLGAYQFFTHSRLIGKLGVFEKFLITPSHHRVHHGRNAKYMDRNYGHIFIIWDRLFGTFSEEEEEPDYGITSGFEEANAYSATFSYWKNLFIRAKRTKRFSDKIKVFLKGPKWTPPDVDHLPNNFKVDSNGNRIAYKINLEKEKRYYVLFSVLITAFSFIGMLIVKTNLGPETSLEALISNRIILAFVGIIIISIYAHSQIIENKKYAAIVDGFRLVSIITLTFFGFATTSIFNWLFPLMCVYSILMAIWLIKINLRPKRTLEHV